MSCEAHLVHPCDVCREAEGSIGDPHVGLVCSGCYLFLIQARGAMEEVGPIVGISHCEEKAA